MSDFLTLASLDSNNRELCAPRGLPVANHPDASINVQLVIGKRQKLESTPHNVTIFSWNILSEYWRARHLLAVNEEEVSTNRFDRIVQWILESASDVVCLQEVDIDVFPQLCLRLSEYGYTGVMQNIKQGKTFQPCGCATFWRNDKFAQTDRVDLSRSLIVTLKTPTDKNISVVNVHLTARQESTSTRARQIKSSLDSTRKRNNQHVIIVGDFNTGANSGLLKTLTQSNLGSEYRFSSVYDHPVLTGSTITSVGSFIVPNKNYTVDHILYTHDNMKMIAVSDPLSKEDRTCTTYLPDALVPSDHLPLMTCLQFHETHTRDDDNQKQLDELTCAEQEKLCVVWQGLQADRPVYHKRGKPSTEDLISLKKYACRVREWLATLTPKELIFAKQLRKQ